VKSAIERNPASVPVGFLLNSGKKEDGDDRKCSSWGRVSFELQATSDVQISGSCPKSVMTLEAL
jgi:hypothetical protein